MRHFSTISKRIKQWVEDGISLFLLLDFDGTLAPIVSEPSQASLPAETKGVLETLRDKGWCTIAIISGRPLDDLIAKIDIEGIIYGGNHGVQLSGPGINFQAPLMPKATGALKTMTYRLKFLRSFIKGVLVEDKGSSLSVHYRGVEETMATAVVDLVEAIARPFLATGLVKVRQGKKVIDITPDSWNKGKAVIWLLERLTKSKGQNAEMLAVYFGDDITDEDAFEVISENGISVLVGEDSSSKARYYVTSPKDVYGFLSSLLDLKQVSASPPFAGRKYRPETGSYRRERPNNDQGGEIV